MTNTIETLREIETHWVEQTIQTARSGRVTDIHYCEQMLEQVRREIAEYFRSQEMKAEF